jgi:hypothetical protein
MYEETCYEKPFLKEVIARIDFAALNRPGFRGGHLV